MPATRVTMECDLYASAFSGEVVFAVKMTDGNDYEGIAPKHFASPTDALTEQPTRGRLEVKLIRNGGKTAYVAFPDGEAAEINAEMVHSQ